MNRIFKPTALGQILNHTSSHSPTTHANWPKAEARRLLRRSSDDQAFQRAKDIFIKRVKRYDAPKDTIQSICKTIPIRRQQFTPSIYRHFAKKETKPVVAWLPLPFHSVWKQSGVAGAVRAFCEKQWHRDLAMNAGIIPDVRVTWKLYSKPFAITIVRN